MAIDSHIEWTEATWNPSTGCTKISPGCKNCYAERLTKRLKAMGQRKYQSGFEYREHPNEIELPLKWKTPKKIFVNSMSDLFHKNSNLEFVGRCFFTMIQADWHTYQILTKRPDKMKEFSELFLNYFGYDIPSHIWMGVSVENQDYVGRIDQLRKVRCNTRFVSFEPLLGPIKNVDLQNIDWVIIGGESGYGFRPIQKDWIIDLIKQCRKQRVVVFFKQWGGVRAKSGGRLLNGKTYDEYPSIVKLENLAKFVTFDERSFHDLIQSKQPHKQKLETKT
jgi:protein gp37